MILKLIKKAVFLLIFALICVIPISFALGEAGVSDTLRNGDSGEKVAVLQRDLRALALLEFQGEPSGEFDEDLEFAVMRLQQMLGVTESGVYNAYTRYAHMLAVESGLLSPFYIEELPLYGCTIGIDAGHQGEADLSLEPIAPGSANQRFAMTSGSFGIRTNNRESLINLSVSMKLAKLLTNLGADVITSRDQEDVSISNAARAKLMNNSNVDFWLRIHCDYSSDQSVFGARILLPNSIQNFNISSASALLGKCVIENYCNTVGTTALITRSLTTETGFNWSNVPVATLELGYLSNVATDLALSTPGYQQKCAYGILLGISEYCFKTELIDADDYSAVLDQVMQADLSEENSDSIQRYIGTMDISKALLKLRRMNMFLIDCIE